jgi:hypothetical protein
MERSGWQGSTVEKLSGTLFILRGMNLGIKYVSPKVDKVMQHGHHN